MANWMNFLMSLVRNKKKKVYVEAHQFNKFMSTGKMLSAFAKITDDVTSKGVFSLEETVKGQTVEQTIIEKHLSRDQ